ncbi:LamG-like jellyroll fold domain-containing protein [Butyricicoccus pullicaecorum]|uniref:LamG-like jellyroll fold domain-containing protein n=1 Tax=Butyricicoccus pullicaecorum 1.2 TaxID=1203606 RepID=R8VZU4_9FIRM|nr:LamG-like jellyroll fold domain-containing protein [Butyricicoccus pullicaecorum]EOQ37939.1 hypothetical protein HMPREF1526_00967 [Butyricicoccus pullicaecorum 1.2]SKA60705.1 Concanavalin A-like lectin/glucanases superfamily protein [Butyricicoccus pullicaecorum DSM 23266]
MAIEWDKNTLLLLHGDSFSDSSYYNVQITNNGSQVSTVQSRFGGTSFYFDGASCIFHDSVWSKIASADFTIDWWEYATQQTNGPRYSSLYGIGQEYGGMMLGYSGELGYCSSVLTQQWDIFSGIKVLDVDVGTWVHRAIIRNGNTLYSYKNGSLFLKTSMSGTIYNDSSHRSAIGKYREGEPDTCFIGYIDEFRISDVARWTEDFTPPTESYKPYIESEEPETGLIPEPSPGDEPVEPSEFSSKLNWSVSDYLNHDDLTRIERNCKILNDKLREYGYIAPIDFRKWSSGEYPTTIQLERIRSNINALQDAWFAVPEWRELMAVYRPDGYETINAEQVNAQEWDLQQMHDYLKAMVAAFELKQAGTPFMIAGGIYNAG